MCRTIITNAFTHTYSVDQTRIVFSKLESLPLPTPSPVAVSDGGVGPQQPSVPIGETVTLQKVKEVPQQTSTNQIQTPPKTEAGAEILPSESWVIVKSENDSQADKSEEKEEQQQQGPVNEESATDKPAVVDSESQSSKVRQAWSGGSRDEATTAGVSQPPATSSRDDDGREGIVNVEDIEEQKEEQEEEDVGARGGSVAKFIFSLKDDSSGDKYSTPTAATPQVRNGS